jgi:hypothetical protein
VTHAGSSYLSGVSFYVNGALVSSSLNNNDPLFNDTVAENEPFVVGGRPNNPGGYVDGEMDEVGLWSRVLTGDEVGELYNEGSGISMSSIPEPSSFALCLLGVTTLLAGRRRRG